MMQAASCIRGADNSPAASTWCGRREMITARREENESAAMLQQPRNGLANGRTCVLDPQQRTENQLH
jgi:hypothetical protein